MFSTDEIILILVTLGALALILRNTLSPDLVALLVLLALGFTHINTPQQTIAGFSSTVVITLMGLFIITQSLENTGVVQWIARRIHRLGRGSEPRLVLIFMATGAGLSLVMNNIAAGAVLLPAAVEVAQISKVRLSKLLMPLSFGTLMGGMSTYLTTANIVLSDLLIKQGLDGLGMQSFLPTGGLIVLCGLVYMLLVGRHLLPNRTAITEDIIPTDFPETYHLEERMWEVKILPNSRLVGMTLEKSRIGRELGMAVLGIWRGRRGIPSPAPDETLLVGDTLVVLGRQERLEQLVSWGTELLPYNSVHFEELQIELTEVVIPPRSTAIGQTLDLLRFRNEFGALVVALWREGRSYRTDVGKRWLQVGDALLVTGSLEQINRLARDKNYLVPTTAYSHSPLRKQKAFWALLITNIVLVSAILNLAPLPELMLAGAAALIITGCLTMEEAYDAIEWRVIFLIAGMLTISTAMSNTGLAARIGLEFAHTLEGASPLVFIAGMFTLTMLVTQVIGAQVAALVIGPIAITTAQQSHISPQAMAVAVATACSTAFLSPIAHPVNMLMMGVGGYTSSDFLKVGIGMAVITLSALLVGMHFFWGIG